MNKQLYIILLLVVSLLVTSCFDKDIDEKEVEAASSGVVLELNIEEQWVVDGSWSVSEVNGSFSDFTQ